jgi:hypothetical protein
MEEIMLDGLLLYNHVMFSGFRLFFYLDRVAFPTSTYVVCTMK